MPGAGGIPHLVLQAQRRPAPLRAQRRGQLKAEIARLFALHGGKYGSPRITADLREAGWQVSENTVAALMREQGLAARRKKKRKSTTRPARGRWRAPDLVKRDFPAAQVNTKWYGDGTEIPTGEGKLYLASVLDMASRRILGFALGEHHDAQLAYGALAMAVAVRGGQAPGVVFHTDQGSEYTAGMVRSACARLGICQSMGRPGSALDNAVIESWHSTLEFELRPGALRHQGASAHPDPGVDRRLQPPPAAFSAADDVTGGLRENPPGREGGLTMNPASPLFSIGRCSAASRSFLPGPDGPAGPPPGHRLRSGDYMAATGSGTKARSAHSMCQRFQGNPGVRSPMACRSRCVRRHARDRRGPDRCGLGIRQVGRR